jgi:ADP-ribose pyrophosphatase
MTQVWQKLNQKYAYKGRFRPIVIKEYKLPNGRVGEFEITGEPGVQAIATLAVTSDSKVIICEQFRPGPEKTMDEIPGGVANHGEDLEAAAKRGLLEETGYEPEKVEPLGSSSCNAYDNIHHHYFLVSGCRKVAEPTWDDYEIINIKLVTVEEFMKIPYKRGMTDMSIYFFANAALEKLREGEKL